MLCTGLTQKARLFQNKSLGRKYTVCSAVHSSTEYDFMTLSARQQFLRAHVHRSFLVNAAGFRCTLVPAASHGTVMNREIERQRRQPTWDNSIFQTDRKQLLPVVLHFFRGFHHGTIHIGAGVRRQQCEHA